MARRILIGITMVLLLAVSAGVGIVAADWPFLKRVISLPDGPGEWPESFYQPVAAIDGGSGGFFPTALPGERTVADPALEAAAQWAGDHGSVALLVLHHGSLQLERYWHGVSGDRLVSGRAMSRSLVSLAYAEAVAKGLVDLADPAEKYLPEWRGDPRGQITVRELLQATSGLEELPLDIEASDPDAPLPQRWLARIRSLTGRNSRLMLDPDFGKVALSFKLAHEPGARFAMADANPQLLGVILERATGRDYERWIEEKIWRPLGASHAEFYMDRANGMPAAYCCFRATPHDWLRLGALLADDGRVLGRPVLPPGWIRRMAVTSRANPLYGLQVWSGKAPAGLREYVPGSGRGVRATEAFVADDTVWMEDAGGRTIWAIPSLELVIVRLGGASAAWDGAVIPNTIVRGIRQPRAAAP
ncbi:MAG: serine hydrolase [Steroidobacteraceae bacterium]